MSQRVSIDPTICHGQACIRGTRIAVHQLVRASAVKIIVDENIPKRTAAALRAMGHEVADVRAMP